MAYDFSSTSSDGRVLYFNILSKNECEVSRMYYTERNSSYVSGNLVLPSSVTDAEGKTYTVVGIGNSAFVHCRSLTAVTVPSTVSYIGNAAFQNCRNLNTVNLPEAVTTIGDEAFENCSSLLELTLPRNVKSIGMEAFEDCEALKTLNVNSVIPPLVNASTFPLDDNEKVPFVLYVPMGTYSSYHSATYWNAFSEIREMGGNNYQNGYAGAPNGQNNGYPQQGNTYQQQGGNQQGNAYVQNGGYQQNGAYPQNNGYAQNSGYPQQNNTYPQQGNAYVQNGGYQQNSAYPQNNGYTQNSGYPQNNAYPQQGNAYPQNNSYQQTGNNAQNNAANGNASDDELDVLQRQVIELQQQNAQFRDAIYRALFSNNIDECKRILHEAMSNK